MSKEKSMRDPYPPFLAHLNLMMKIAPMGFAVAGGCLAWTIAMGVLPSPSAFLLNCAMGIAAFSLAYPCWRIGGSLVLFLTPLNILVLLFGTRFLLEVYYQTSIRMGLPALQILALLFLAYFGLVLGLRAHLRRVLKEQTS